MTLSIAFCQHVAKTGRLTVSLDTDLDATRLKLRIDGVNQPGKFIDTHWVGTLYQHSDGEWGLPGLGFGPAVASILYTTPGTDFGVGKPPSSNISPGDPSITPEALLEHCWAAGFRTEQHLLWCVSIARGESGFFTKARNWTPQDGMRPAGDVIGVEGPPAAWDKLHEHQGHSDRGVFQWNSRAHPDISDHDADDPATAAVWMFKKTGNATAPVWTPWGFGAGGDAYSKWFAQFLPIVKSFRASKGV